MKLEKKPAMFVHIPACNHERLQAFKDSMNQCGVEHKDWLVDKIPTSPEHMQRFKVRTDMIETLREICTKQGLFLTDKI